MARYEVNKSSSPSRPWQVCDTVNGRSVHCSGRKKEAELLCDTYNANDAGDYSAWVKAVRVYYRYVYCRIKKSYLEDYKRHLGMLVLSMGWDPGLVDADPETMEPR